MATNDDGTQDVLYHALGGAFSRLDCRKAVLRFNHDLSVAADWLCEGGWATNRTVEWDQPSLDANAKQLQKVSGRDPERCMSVLKNCAGNVDLAARKLAGLPALPSGDPAHPGRRRR